MLNYVVEGKVKMGREVHDFKKDIDADSEDMAKEKLYSLLGGDHGVSRNKIQISNIRKE